MIVMVNLHISKFSSIYKFKNLIFTWEALGGVSVASKVPLLFVSWNTEIVPSKYLVYMASELIVTVL